MSMFINAVFPRHLFPERDILLRLKLSLLHGENAERGGVLQCISDTVGGARGDAAMPRLRGLGTPHDLCGFVCRTKIICALKFLILVYTAFLYGSVPLYTYVK